MSTAALQGTGLGLLAGVLVGSVAGLPHVYLSHWLAAALCGGVIGAALVLGASWLHERLINEPMDQATQGAAACALLGALTLVALLVVDNRTTAQDSAFGQVAGVDHTLQWLHAALVGGLMGGGLGYLIGRRLGFVQETKELLGIAQQAPDDMITWLKLGILAVRQAHYQQGLDYLAKARGLSPGPDEQDTIARWMTRANRGLNT